MTIALTNQGHELHINIVSLEESDIYQRLIVKQSASWAKKAHARAKAFLHGDGTFKGHKELLEEAQKLLQKEQAKLSTHKEDLRLSDFSFEWEDPQREARFKSLHSLCKKARDLNHKLMELAGKINKAKIFEVKYEAFLHKIHKQGLALESHLSFFVLFFNLYHKTESRLQRHSHIEQLEKGHKMAAGTLTPKYVNQLITTLLKEFAGMIKETEQCMEYLNEIVSIDKALRELESRLTQADTDIRNWEGKVNHWEELESELHRLRAMPLDEKDGTVRVSIRIKSVARQQKDIPLPSSEELEETAGDLDHIEEVLTNAKDLKIFKTQPIHNKLEDLKKSLLEIHDKATTHEILSSKPVKNTAPI